MKIMNSDHFDIPILICVYRRPDTTQTVYNSIKKVKPKKLFVSANAPNPDNEGEKEKTDIVKAVFEQIDWDCEIKTNFRKEHLSCKHSISSAIDWFFDHVEMGIILEDDCFPDKSFFSYSEELLKMYEFDSRIMQIGGCNYNFKHNIHHSYFYSKYVNIWGWATWRRAWKYYHIAESFDNLDINNVARFHFNNKSEIRRRIKNFKLALSGEIDSWDYIWSLSCLAQNAYSIIPKYNLISNLGFRNDATRTKQEDSTLANLILQNMDFPLTHPKYFIHSSDYDEYISNNYTKPKPGALSLIKKFVQ